MDQLPQELVDRISSYLSPDGLKNTLLLSHAFRFSAEKYSGAFARFAQMKTPPRSSLTLPLIRLPLPEDSERRDNADQLSKHDKSFTQQITFLFKTMKTVEEHAGTQNKPGIVRLAISSPWRPIFRGRSLLYHDHLSWRVHSLEPEALPLLESVRFLEVGDGWNGSLGRRADDADYNWARVKLDYRVVVDLVVKLPYLEYWGCRIGGDEWSPKTVQEATRYFTQDWVGPRRDTRQGFAKALLSARLPDSLRRVRLDFLHDLHNSTHIDHLTAQPDLVSPAANDLFSTSLHHLSHHLRRLHLRVPEGQWYFIGPNGEGRDTAAFKVTDTSYPPLETTPYDEETDGQIEEEGDRRYRGGPNTRIRIVPKDTTLRPFLAAFDKAVSNMRALQEAVLWCLLAWAPNDEDGEELETDWLLENCPDADRLAWGVHCQAKDEPNFTQQGGNLPTEVPLLWWKVGKWRPDPELHELFQQIGRTPWGDGLKEHWEDEDYGEGLVDREYFEYCVQEEVDKVGRIPPPN
ncbi:hypothetical protein BU25DRAFT_431133 [Macroventuria anomochaeta]|uniref:Uncharacterized protein n=1 Tax=Macroventuria anomochaeta TaxID=301207 RepID=A0ACB6S1F7_9PLEO|nr:uncharacterized protein BU25DRAFT_431133 [Macroventuria anomochaeta]KAF2627797.1 hypothetical protein BU25DRAFT_431133 [Macroventuria anomochaeta]